MPNIKIMQSGPIPNHVEMVVVTEAAQLTLPGRLRRQAHPIVNSSTDAASADVQDFIQVTAPAGVVNNQTGKSTAKFRFKKNAAASSVAVIGCIYSAGWIVTADRDGQSLPGSHRNHFVRIRGGVPVCCDGVVQPFLCYRQPATMSHPALSLLKPGSEISAASTTVFFSNTAADDQLMLPSSGVYPGWSCDIILADGATNIRIAGAGQSINGGTVGGASTDKRR